MSSIQAENLIVKKHRGHGKQTNSLNSRRKWKSGEYCVQKTRKQVEGKVQMTEWIVLIRLPHTNPNRN